MQQHVRLTSYARIIEYAHAVVDSPGLALQVRHMHSVVEQRNGWDPFVEYDDINVDDDDRTREARAIRFSALLSIVTACKNLE